MQDLDGNDNEIDYPELQDNYAVLVAASEGQFAIIETCYSGVVGQGCTGIPGLLMMTAANPYETSKADAFDNELHAYLSNTFTSSILSWLETNPQSIIRDLYVHAFDKTNGSHVMVYNSDYYGSLYLNDMGEYYPDGQYARNNKEHFETK